MQIPLMRSRFRFFSNWFVQDSMSFSIFNAKNLALFPPSIGSSYWNPMTISPRVSSFPFGPVYIQHTHPTSTSQKIYHTSFRYSQSLNKPFTSDPWVSSFPIGFRYTQHVNPPDNQISFSHKRQDYYFIWLSYIFRKKLQHFKNLSRFETGTK